MFARSNWPNIPPHGTPINLGHPLARSLVACHLLNTPAKVYDQLRPACIAGFGSSTLLTPNGAYFNNAQSYAIHSSYGPNQYSGPDVSGGPFSVMVVCTPTVAGALYGVSDVASIRQMFSVQVFDMTTITFVFWFDDLAVAVPNMAGKRCVIVATFDTANTQRIYYNGVDKGSRTAGGTLALSNLVWGVGGFPPNTFLYTYGGTIEAVYVWKRCLLPGEIFQLSATPYAFFKSNPLRPWAVFPIERNMSHNLRTNKLRPAIFSPGNAR